MNDQASAPHWYIVWQECGHTEDRGISFATSTQTADGLCPDCRPKPEPVRPWRGATPGESPETLVRLIRERGPLEVVGMVQGDAIVAAALEDGLDLIRWTAHHTAGCVMFARLGDDDRPNAPAIVCLNAPESDRWRWQDDLGPDAIVLMLPQGQQRYEDGPDGPF